MTDGREDNEMPEERVTTPQRIRLSRAKGWRMPENAVKVDRSTKWGNPFIVGEDGTRAECVGLYRKLLCGFPCLTCKAPLQAQRGARDYARQHIDQLRGRDLACWCALDGPCHADVLIEIANATPDPMADPDTIIRFLEADHDDPDRQIALRITNFLAGMDIRKAIAVYSLAMTMSLRGIEGGHQRAALRAICEACLKSWAIARGEPEPRPCHECKGAGTIGATLEDYETCPVCAGTGAA